MDDTAGVHPRYEELKMKELPNDTVESVESIVQNHNLLSLLDVRIERLNHELAVLRMPYDQQVTNSVRGGEGFIHGGITATLLDTASGIALRTTFEEPGEAALTTTSLDLSFARPASDDLYAEAEVVRAGDTVGVTRATATSDAPDGERKEVAVGTTAYRLFRDH